MPEIKESSKYSHMAKTLTKQALAKISSDEKQIVKDTIADSIKKYVQSLFNAKFQKAFGNVRYETFVHHNDYDMSKRALFDLKLNCIDDYSEWLSRHNNITILNKKSYTHLGHGHSFYGIIASYIITPDNQSEHSLDSKDEDLLLKYIKKNLK